MMEKIITLLKAFGIELSADQKKQLDEVGAKEYVAAAEAAKTATELEELKKLLAQRDADLDKLRSDTTSDDLKKQLEDLKTQYASEKEELTNKLTQQETDFAAERLLSGYSFASERIKQSVLQEFKGKGFKFENGKFIGGAEFLEELKKNEPSAFAQDKQPGLFMGSTQSTVAADANNAKSEIFEGFGLTNNK